GPGPARRGSDGAAKRNDQEPVMNRYPLWKYVLIALTLVVWFIYTLPNFFGEVPAVQVSPLKATLKADAALRSRVEDILQKNKVTSQAISLDATSVKARFEDTDTQLRAKDALQSA